MIKIRLAERKNLEQHVLFWGLYGVYFYVVNVLGNEEVTVGLVFMSLPYFAFIFYTVLYMLRLFLPKKRMVECALSLLLFYTVSTVAVWAITNEEWELAAPYNTYTVENYEFDWNDFVRMSMVMHCQFSILAFVYYHYCGKLEEERAKVAQMEKWLEVEAEKREYEYVALSAQVSPHLMGNIFQSWSKQLRDLAPAIANEMSNVYELMKFYMRAHDPKAGETILLQDEVQAVRRFLIAQKAVFKRDFYIEWDIDGNLMRFGIPPTTVLTLVKNAFKHGDIYAEETPLRIQIAVEWCHYTVAVLNKKRDGDVQLQSHGVGLHNLRRRLDLVYGDRARFESTDSGDMYRIDLYVDFALRNMA